MYASSSLPVIKRYKGSEKLVSKFSVRLQSKTQDLFIHSRLCYCIILCINTLAKIMDHTSS